MPWRWLLVLPPYFCIFAASYLLAYSLRFDFEVPAVMWQRFAATLPLVLAVKATMAVLTRQWQRKHRYTTLVDFGYVAGASCATALVLLAANSFVPAGQLIPRSVILIDSLLTVMSFSVLRASIRGYVEMVAPRIAHASLETKVRRKKALVYGSDSAAVAIMRALKATAPEYRVRGFVSNNPGGRESLIADTPVYSSKLSLSEVVEQSRAKLLLIPAVTPGREVRELLHQCHDAGITAHVIPAVDEIVSGRYKLAIRDVTISDLLRREPNQLDMEGIRGYITGKRVLVTGAAGSIGSELCRQILALRPESLVLLDQSESGVFAMEQEFAGRPTGGTKLQYEIADIRDRDTLNGIMERQQPQIIFHAAAYKHVPLMEANPQEAIRNNVFGTKTLVDLADHWQAERFVFVSTDKAVRPTSVMGSTKLIAEKYLQAVAQRSETQFMTVRFGNVLNSVGSVVPTFRRQIQEGGPITVTHPEMNRFFMTIPEAVQLVLQAGALGESGAVLILEMGEPVKIVDLARDMIYLSGLKYPDDIDIVFTGLRPGEKLYEELFYESEMSGRKVHEKIRCGQRSQIPVAMVKESLHRLESSLQQHPTDSVTTLWEIVNRFVAIDESQPAQVAKAA